MRCRDGGDALIQFGLLRDFDLWLRLLLRRIDQQLQRRLYHIELLGIANPW
jgi:hypothetical protein